MKIEQPPAPNSRPKTTNLLELAIYDFEQKAEKYHASLAKRVQKDETPEIKAARIRQREIDFAHLNSERIRIKQFADIQADLEKYKKKNREFLKQIKALILLLRRHTIQRMILIATWLQPESPSQALDTMRTTW